MKSFMLAVLFFGVVAYGLYDVKPYRAVRKLVRKVGKGTGPVGPLPIAPPSPEPPQEAPLSRRYR